MDVLVQFDRTGSYQDNPWDLPVSYQKGEIHSVTPLAAIVLIDRREAHLYFHEQDKQIASTEK